MVTEVLKMPVSPLKGRSMFLEGAVLAKDARLRASVPGEAGPARRGRCAWADLIVCT